MADSERNQNIEVKLAVIERDVFNLQNQLTTQGEDLKKGFKDIKDSLQEHYLTKTEFEPVKKVVYGLIGMVLVTIAAAVVALVLK